MQMPDDSKQESPAATTDGEKQPFPTMPVVLAIMGVLLLVVLIVFA